MAEVAPRVNIDCFVVYLAGSSEVNGVYRATQMKSDGIPMFRKEGSNIGLLRFDDKKLYISDCGDEFKPAGLDHLDYYISESIFETNNMGVRLLIGEDGKAPAPKIEALDEEGLGTLVKALRMQGMKLKSNGNINDAIAHIESLQAIRIGATVDDYVVLADLYIDNGMLPHALSTLLRLSRETALLFDPNPLFTKDMRVKICSLLCKCVDYNAPMANMVEILRHKSLYPFFEFIIPLAESARNRMELKNFNPKAIDDASIDAIVRAADERMAFQLAGGVEVAVYLREFYRQIELYSLDQRDSAINRMKIFSVTDSFRQYASDGRLDTKGRDGTFKNFWEAGIQREQDDRKIIDPREEDARIKDLDPAKEMKCSVIKSINVQKNEGIEKVLARRAELLDIAPDTHYSLDDIHRCDCNNIALKLISIHGIVFDVTHNLEKYAPDGEYFFISGHDITYPLAVSSLSGDHVDELYQLEKPEHLKRVYGWMEYFVNKYKIIGKMREYENEKSWNPPPQGEEEPDMQCSIM